MRPARELDFSQLLLHCSASFLPTAATVPASVSALVFYPGDEAGVSPHCLTTGGSVVVGLAVTAALTEKPPGFFSPWTDFFAFRRFLFDL